jgi:hypothetical protein
MLDSIARKLSLSLFACKIIQCQPPRSDWPPYTSWATLTLTSRDPVDLEIVVMETQSDKYWNSN